MKTIHSMIAALGLAFVLPGAAEAASSDPEVIIYRFPGVRDDGGSANVGVATLFHCTNFSGTGESIRFATRQSDGTLVTNVLAGLPHLSSITISTHSTLAYQNRADLLTGALGQGVGQGTTAIAATSTNIICTAMTIGAANPKPDGVALRGIRLNLAPGSQE
jgi:hypothetical protein